MNAVETFNALGDPTRLTMIQRLSCREFCTLSDLMCDLPITRQGARRHLQVLADCQLVTLTPMGRNTAARLNKETLSQSKEFIANIESQWEKRLEALRDFVEN